MGVPMGRALEIRDDLGAHELRGWARKAGNGRASARAFAIANALNGLKRAAAARLVGMERQALRDAVAREHDLKLRQSYVRVAKRAAIMAGRYAHAKQWKRQRRQLKFLRTRLGRLIRDIRRKTEGDADLTAAFAEPLSRASQVRSQQQRQRGWKLYSLHAPEVECIAKGKAHKPYEFGCKVSITTTNARSPGGQFVLHAKAFHGRPYDGHTLGTVITETQALTGVEIKRVYVDKG